MTLTELKAKIAANEDVTGVDTSNIVDMSGLFSKNTTFNQDISGWNVRTVERSPFMFYSAEAFSYDISNWVMWKNMDLRCMFVNTPNHNKNISHFQLPPGHDKTDYNRADASENEQE